MWTLEGNRAARVSLARSRTLRVRLPTKGALLVPHEVLV